MLPDKASTNIATARALRCCKWVECALALAAVVSNTLELATCIPGRSHDSELYVSGADIPLSLCSEP